MNRWAAAFRLFFRVLFDRAFAERAISLLLGESAATTSASPTSPMSEATPAAAPTAAAPTAAPKAPPPRGKPDGQEALLLLATLQREARLIDFLKEDLGPYSDDQVGAAVREVHRDAAATLERLFALRPVVAEGEGARVVVPADHDPARFHLTGNLPAAGLSQVEAAGTLRHHGWEATELKLPQLVGKGTSLSVVAPAEVELGR